MRQENVRRAISPRFRESFAFKRQYQFAKRFRLFGDKKWSGRWRAIQAAGKASVEGCRSIDVLEWHRRGYLRSPRWFSWAWTRDGERVASINVETQRHAVTLKYRSRSYGEDWSDVALALSTARPSAATRLPDEPDPWYLDLYRPAPPPAPAPRMAYKATASLSSFVTTSALVDVLAGRSSDVIIDVPIEGISQQFAAVGETIKGGGVFCGTYAAGTTERITCVFFGLHCETWVDGGNPEVGG